MTTPQPSEQPRLDDCKHDQIVRMVLADESHDWQCVGCGSFFVPYQRREPERGVETLLYDVTEAAATMLEADEFASVDERRLIRAVSAARGYFMHADPPEAAAPDPVASPPEAVNAAIRSLRDLSPDAEWTEKFYAALEAMARLATGHELVAEGTPPHVVMARFIDDLAWRAVASPAPLDVERLAEAIAIHAGNMAKPGRHDCWSGCGALIAAEYARLEGQPVAEEGT